MQVFSKNDDSYTGESTSTSGIHEKLWPNMQKERTQVAQIAADIHL